MVLSVAFKFKSVRNRFLTLNLIPHQHTATFLRPDSAILYFTVKKIECNKGWMSIVCNEADWDFVELGINCGGVGIIKFCHGKDTSLINYKKGHCCLSY